MSDGWNQALLQKHLQAAVDLELWTIPFYMAAMYSLEDSSSTPFQLIQSIVHQEMLHVQLAANLANAFGLSPTFKIPAYRNKHIPHLDFNLDTPNPTSLFAPYSAEIGPLDLARLNAFCLIEYPEWDAESEPSPKASIEDYGSIGEFYGALAIGIAAVVEQDPASLQGDVKQVNLFERFYGSFAEPPTHVVQYQPETQAMCITEGGRAGVRQALRLMAVITSQGEGQVQGEQDIPASYRNTADDPDPVDAHFAKFNELRNAAVSNAHLAPEYPWKIHPLIHHPPASPQGAEQKAAQERLKRNFEMFLERLEQLFSGGKLPPTFGVEMATLGGNIRRCWQLGAVPTF